MRSADGRFEDFCSLLTSVLHGPIRSELVAALADAATLGRSLLRLRESMRANAFDFAGRRFGFAREITGFDALTRQEGFHVLHDWDGKADRVNPNTIPVDVLDYIVRRRGDDPPDSVAIAILLDYYFIHVLELVSLRVWDEGDADANLDRIAALLAHLQGPCGSGQPFVSDAETLILIATSHFELHERGYRRLLDRTRTLGADHQLRIAMGHAASMGSHLRFGFEASYARDTGFMRGDNVADYPWLSYALTTLMREFSRIRSSEPGAPSRALVVEALLNGLSADPRAFVGPAIPALWACQPDRDDFADSFGAHRDTLMAEFEPFRPTERDYSPLSFFFNFSHNVRKGTVVDALLRGEPWRLTFNDLLTGLPREPEASASKQLLARTLMTYARLNPDRIRGRLMPVIVYDPGAGRQAFGATLRQLRE